ncbi:MAG: hypothetical protein IIA41_11740, partial [SAR324 cluster bacterium]|nr:hypothetical protein [SAR324 cluster bacterium]
MGGAVAGFQAGGPLGALIGGLGDLVLSNSETQEFLAELNAGINDVLGPILRDFDAFICPTVSCPEIPAANWQKDTIIVDGRSLTDTDMAMTVLFNMFSRCPVLAVPSGMTDAGLPTGLQIVGRPYDDAMTFRVARALERARPWLNDASRRATPA